ncbi:hypothetical protein [Flavobacterium notoginsengisoli]
MKKLEDFACEKVEVNVIGGTWAAKDAYTFCEVKGQELNDYDGIDPNSK